MGMVQEHTNWRISRADPMALQRGPDGQIYVCNDGGFSWEPIPLPNKQELWIGGNQPADYNRWQSAKG